MKQNNTKGAWVRSSSTPKRDERLMSHEEFEASDLKKMLDNDWKVKSIKVERPKRPRIKKEPKPRKLVIAISGWESMGTIEVSFEDYERDYKSCCRIVTKFF
jgi:hypothetical protein